MTVRPAAGPLTPRAEWLTRGTRMPPIMPAINPENNGAPEAIAMPKQRGTATKNTTTPAGIS